jgi:two-component system, NarL family, sensor histidine kinase UhpB
MSDSDENHKLPKSENLTSFGTTDLKIFADTLEIDHPEIFRFVTEQLQTALLIVDKEMKIVYCNPFCCDMLGYTATELTGSSFLMPMSEAGRQEAMGYFERRRSGIAENHPFTWQHRNGHPVHTTIYTTPIKDRNGAFAGAIGLIHDMTKEQELQQHVSVNEARFRAVSEFSRSLIWEVDAAGRFIYIGENVKEILGYAQEEACHKLHFYDLTPADNREEVRATGLEKMSRREPFRNYLNPLQAKDGSVVWVRTNGMSVYDDEGSYIGYQGIDTDVTESRMLGLQLLEVSERLEGIRGEALRARENERTLLSRELHDQFGQSLMAIRYNLDWLSGHEVINDELRERIGKITSVVQDSITMVQNYAFDLRPAALDEKGFLDAMKEYCSRFFEDTGITGTLTAEGMTEPVLESHSIALYRILQEALTNVARHARASEVAVTLQQQDEAIYLIVKDNGVGMSEHAKEHSRSIGLKGMKERAAYLGGWCTFEVNRGTTVKAKVPLKG